MNASSSPKAVEPVFGIIKRVMGWRQMSMRGLDKARGEWSLVTMAWNIKRLHVLRAAEREGPMSPTILETQPCNEPRAICKALRRLDAIESGSRRCKHRRVVGIATLRPSSPTGS